MPRAKGTPKTGGRQPGVSNKAPSVAGLKRTVDQILEAKGCDPFAILADLAEHKEPGIRLNAAKELAQYVSPKMRALVVHADINMDLAKQAAEYEKLDPKEQLALMEAEVKRLKGEI